MNEIETLLILTPIAAICCIMAFFFAFKNRSRQSSYLCAQLLSSFLILTGQFFELLSREPARIMLFSRLTYTVIAIAPVFWFMFALEMTGGNRTPFRRLFYLLSVIPLATAIVAWTNPVHRLLWERTEFREIGRYTVNVVLEYGPWFWVHTSYSYVLYIAGIVLVVREFINHQSLFRFQAMCVLTGVILPFLINLLYVFRILDNRVKDFTPLEIALSGLFFYIGVKKYGLATIRQIPRDEVYKRYADPMLVVDAQRRIVDWNEQLTRSFPIRPQIGMPIADALRDIDANALDASALPSNGAGPSFVSVQIPEGELTRTVNARIQPLVLSPDGEVSGWCITLFTHMQSPNPALALSRQERKVLALVTEDLSNKEIAIRLNIGESTVKTHVHNLLKKTGAAKRSELREFSE